MTRPLGLKHRLVARRRSRQLQFESLEGRSLLAPVADIVNINPDPRTTPVGQVIVNFTESTTSQPTAVNGVDINDFRLTRDGNSVSLAAVPLSGSGDSYSLDLTTVTMQDGTYILTLVASGSQIVNTAGMPLTQDAI